MKPRSIRCMKFFIALFNIIFILFGLVLMAICVINMRERKAQAEQSALSRGVLSFLLTVGLALVVTAILGCIGALRENIKILYVHACFLIFLVSVEVMVGVGGAVLSAWVGGGSELRMQFYKNTTVEDDGSNLKMFWDNLQSEPKALLMVVMGGFMNIRLAVYEIQTLPRWQKVNQCCGVDGPQDYAILDRDVPTSCCARAHPLREGGARRHLHSTCLNDKSYYMRGCEEIMRQKKSLKGKIFISTGVLFTLLEIICIILAIWMARTVRNERRKLQQNLQAHFES